MICGAQAKRVLGIGGDGFHANNNLAISLGYLKRKQGRVTEGRFAGDFAGVSETLNLGDGHYTTWRRDIFDRIKAACDGVRARDSRDRQTRGLEAKACALLFYIHAHAYTCNLSASQIGERFGWSQATLWRISKPLRQAGLLPATGYRRLHLPDTQHADAPHPETETFQQPDPPPFHQPGTQQPDSPINEPTKGTDHQETHDQGTHNEHSRTADDDVSREREEAADDDVFAKTEQIVATLRAADCVKKLDERLFTAKRRRELLRLLDKHGNAAKELILKTVDHGEAYDAGRIISWHYFEVALSRQAAEAEKMAAYWTSKAPQRVEAEVTEPIVDDGLPF